MRTGCAHSLCSAQGSPRGACSDQDFAKGLPPLALATSVHTQPRMRTVALRQSLLPQQPNLQAGQTRTCHHHRLVGRVSYRSRQVRFPHLITAAGRAEQSLSSLSHSIQQGYHEASASPCCIFTALHVDSSFSATVPPLSVIPQQLTSPSSFMQLCIENAGRPAAAALTQLVRCTACAFRAGHSMDRLRLEVEHGGFNEVTLSSGSARLTETDKQYRKQFLDAVRHAVHCKHATSPQYLYLILRQQLHVRMHRCTSPCK